MIKAICPETLTVRENSEAPVICGYFAVYDQETELWGKVREKIAAGAFDKSLKENDIRCLFNHDHGFVLGRVSAGTLTLRSDNHGLYGEVMINPNDTQAMSVYERVKRRDISGCSFGFDPVNEDVEMRDGAEIWTVREADTIEVSVCTFPAYSGTDIQARQQAFDSKHKDIRKKRISGIQKRLEAIKNGSKNSGGKNGA